MSKRPLYYPYESPNIVIVPTVNFHNCPQKKQKLESVDLLTNEKHLTSHENVTVIIPSGNTVANYKYSNCPDDVLQKSNLLKDPIKSVDKVDITSGPTTNINYNNVQKIPNLVPSFDNWHNLRKTYKIPFVSNRSTKESECVSNKSSNNSLSETEHDCNTIMSSCTTNYSNNINTSAGLRNCMNNDSNNYISTSAGLKSDTKNVTGHESYNYKEIELNISDSSTISASLSSHAISKILPQKPVAEHTIKNKCNDDTVLATKDSNLLKSDSNCKELLNKTKDYAVFKSITKSNNLGKETANNKNCQQAAESVIKSEIINKTNLKKINISLLKNSHSISKGKIQLNENKSKIFPNNTEEPYLKKERNSNIISKSKMRNNKNGSKISKNHTVENVKSSKYIPSPTNKYYEKDTISKNKAIKNKINVEQLNNEKHKYNETKDETFNQPPKIKSSSSILDRHGQLKQSSTVKSVVKVKENCNHENFVSKPNKDLRAKLIRNKMHEYDKKLSDAIARINKKFVNIPRRHDNLIITVDNETNSGAENSEIVKKPPKQKKSQNKVVKRKKIKLIIKVTSEKTASSSDTEDNSDKKENENLTNDFSFLDDFNVDEIVESLNECDSKLHTERSEQPITVNINMVNNFSNNDDNIQKVSVEYNHTIVNVPHVTNTNSNELQLPKMKIESETDNNSNIVNFEQRQDIQTNESTVVPDLSIVKTENCEDEKYPKTRTPDLCETIIKKEPLNEGSADLNELAQNCHREVEENHQSHDEPIIYQENKSKNQLITRSNQSNNREYDDIVHSLENIFSSNPTKENQNKEYDAIVNTLENIFSTNENHFDKHLDARTNNNCHKNIISSESTNDITLNSTEYKFTSTVIPFITKQSNASNVNPETKIQEKKEEINIFHERNKNNNTFMMEEELISTCNKKHTKNSLSHLTEQQKQNNTNSEFKEEKEKAKEENTKEPNIVDVINKNNNISVIKKQLTSIINQKHIKTKQQIQSKTNFDSNEQKENKAEKENTKEKNKVHERIENNNTSVIKEQLTSTINQINTKNTSSIIIKQLNRNNVNSESKKKEEYTEEESSVHDVNKNRSTYVIKEQLTSTINHKHTKSTPSIITKQIKLDNDNSGSKEREVKKEQNQITKKKNIVHEKSSTKVINTEEKVLSKKSAVTTLKTENTKANDINNKETSSTKDKLLNPDGVYSKTKTDIHKTNGNVQTVNQKENVADTKGHNINKDKRINHEISADVHKTNNNVQSENNKRSDKNKKEHITKDINKHILCKKSTDMRNTNDSSKAVTKNTSDRNNINQDDLSDKKQSELKTDLAENNEKNILHKDKARTSSIPKAADIIKSKLSATTVFSETVSKKGELKNEVKSSKNQQNILKDCITTESDEIFRINIEERMLQYFNERYSVTSLIHKGNFSRLYTCKNARGENYVIKILNNESDRYPLGTCKETMLKTLQRDVPKCNYNCVYLFDGFGTCNRWCFLMEYYPKTLEQALIENQKSFHINTVQSLSRQLIGAITILRNNNIIHSDIKPSHILLNASNKKLKLCGFDSAYKFGVLAKPLPDVGTLSYRAPEIILGYTINFAIDVWSAATVMYEMATNRQLFPGTSNNNVLFKQMCILGHMPHNMISMSAHQKDHFSGSLFIRRYYKKMKVLPYMFNKTAKIGMNMFNIYKQEWESSNYIQKKQDRAKLSSLNYLLDQMLQLQPEQRLGIEFVFANPFIYQCS